MTPDTFDDLATAGVVELLKSGRAFIQSRLNALDPQIGNYNVYADRQPVLEILPCVEVVRAPVDVKWFATTVYEEYYTWNLDCSIRSAKREFGTKLLTTFAHAILCYLNALDKKQWFVPNTKNQVFDSQCTGWDANYRRGAGLRTARLVYWAKLLRPAIKTVDP